MAWAIINRTIRGGLRWSDLQQMRISDLMDIWGCVQDIMDAEREAAGGGSTP